MNNMWIDLIMAFIYYLDYKDYVLASKQENNIYLKQMVCSCMVVLAHQENMPFASLTKIKIGGWEEAYWKLNLRIDHLNAVMRYYIRLEIYNL